MATNPKDKVVVVTGGARGIGYAIADQFLANGAKNVVILDINEEAGRKAEKTLKDKYGEERIYFIKCDIVTDLKSASQEIYTKFGSVDVLVNNAAVSNVDIDSVIDINLRALIKWSFAFWEKMRKDKSGNGGTIINLSSIYGLTVQQHFPDYHATKFGVIGFSKSLGHEFNFSRSGVRVVVLCPGWTNTTERSDKLRFDEEELRESLMEIVKEVVWQTAETVGKAAVELFEKALSGTVWKIENGEPLTEVV
ncbi:15-hydroxyprostaglandin dehydrogenase [NAD(+)]-like [Epargyreus clarus]|uniref:15-hydroxyprostaglandin dehydrogenase [NAD(+)]-like n=1 Tax=Epargyreus clarus TaxID=520877 RepID=UPI003C3046E2